MDKHSHKAPCIRGYDISMGLACDMPELICYDSEDLLIYFKHYKTAEKP